MQEMFRIYSPKTQMGDNRSSFLENSLFFIWSSFLNNSKTRFQMSVKFYIKIFAGSA